MTTPKETEEEELFLIQLKSSYTTFKALQNSYPSYSAYFKSQKELIQTKTTKLRSSSDSEYNNFVEDLETLPEGTKRLLSYTKDLKIQLHQVEPNYYDWSLEKRALKLKVEISSLCKTLLFENTKHNGENTNLNSKYYLVVVQYKTKLNAQMLLNYIRSLTNKSIPKKYYNFRIPSEEVCEELTGYKTGGVNPFGSNLPIIIEEKILKEEVVVLGAGHVDWKVSFLVKDFLNYFEGRYFVADLERKKMLECNSTSFTSK